ncbi:MAG: hypothetical protein Unbinned1966contig1000_8 [Prokaryotic dsDNA virus sp.]|mgnify:FL=1|nr:MAG: hypothetical protein Unbinned1966contig1000_8 [Prokaryotic dsDNA virus sp.]|tara:strand:- start:15983 stop:16147 length:165 start_codon:yes stop_codon:yes gene_type:complete
MELNHIDKTNLEWIEQYLENTSYSEIPESFINQVDQWFETVSYIKSLVELKKQS